MSLTFDIKAFSHHLFWDVDRNKLDLEKHKRQIVQQVLEYGLLNDWLVLRKFLTIDEIARVAMNLRSLEDRSLSFISLLAKIPKEQFRCYSTGQSNPRHWNF